EALTRGGTGRDAAGDVSKWQIPPIFASLWAMLNPAEPMTDPSSVSLPDMPAVFPDAGDLAVPGQKRFYIESYGCQMNFSDSEIVASILSAEGFAPIRDIEGADLILLNTCSIREKAEETIRKRLRTIDKLKLSRPGTLVGIL